MARLIGYLAPVHLEQGRVLRPRRTLAVATIVVLLSATVAPGWAVAAEPDSEGEGGAPPGLENPHFEPGGEETALESLPGVVGSESGSEESASVETEPAEEPQLPEAELPPPVVEAPAPEAPVGALQPSSAPVEAPTYEAAPAAPDYSPPPPAAAPVENEPIVAPPSESKPKGASHQSPPPEGAEPEVVAEAPPPVTPSEEENSPPPAPAPVATPDPGGGGPSRLLAGRSSYKVRPGDCLWSIASALLPPGASNAEIASEVARLWRQNAARIGTGDPNVILVGTALALG